MTLITLLIVIYKDLKLNFALKRISGMIRTQFKYFNLLTIHIVSVLILRMGKVFINLKIFKITFMIPSGWRL